MRKEVEDWGDYKRLPGQKPEISLVRRMLLGVDSVVHTPRLRAFDPNERRMAKFSESMDPCFVGKNAAALAQFVDESLRNLRVSRQNAPSWIWRQLQ